MEYINKIFLDVTSDSLMFWVLQSVLFACFLFVLIRNFVVGKGRQTFSVKRGKESMTLFYGAYVTLNGLLIALCLSVEVIKNYRIFWVLVDTMISAYICLFNTWSRNKLLEWAIRLREIEKR